MKAYAAALLVLLLAAAPPGKRRLLWIREYLATQLAKQDVKINLGVDVTPEIATELKALYSPVVLIGSTYEGFDSYRWDVI